MLEFESDLYETCLINYFNLVKFSSIQHSSDYKSEKRVLMLNKVWPDCQCPLMPTLRKTIIMALLSLYTMLKGKYHGDFDLTRSKLCYNTFI